MRLLVLLAFILGGLIPALSHAAQAEESRPPPVLRPAFRGPMALHAPMMEMARAGNRLVAVGDYGTVLLSDDGGKSWRQARSVAVDTMLTTVAFTGPETGWAAGHGGVILKTVDGGETWTVAHRAAPDMVLMSIAFQDSGRGLAVGAYGAALLTEDGGATWAAIELGKGDDADRHLNHVAVSAAGTILVAGETGTIFRSADGGRGWSVAALPMKGSVWRILALGDRSLLATAMGGRMFRSTDDGLNWTVLPSPTTQSLSGATQLADGRIVVVGLAGTVLTSRSDGSFGAFTQPDRVNISAALAAEGAEVLLAGINGITRLDVKTVTP